MPPQVDHPTPPGTLTSAAVSKGWRTFLLPAICCLLVVIVYAGFLRTGSWTTRPNVANDYFTDYYDQLATSFLHGQLSLEAKPEPALLALSNPYAPEERKGISFPLDVSLHGGKYYLYFGPVPAILLLLPKALIPGQIGDQYLVFLFATGIFLLETLFIVDIWRRFFPDLSPAIVTASTILVGLVSPFTWILRQPNIYNAVILSGQLCFLAGLYAAFEALDGKSVATWKLVLAGIFWAAAVGSRITQILPVGLMAALVVARLIGKYRGQQNASSRVIRGMLAYGLPLALGLAALGWYNWARFGSIIETGIAYQLSGFPLQTYGQSMFSPAYVVQNLYNYLLNPPKPTDAFPYLRPNNGFARRSVVEWIRLPKIYWSQDVSGLIYTAPFIVFAILPAIEVLRSWLHRTRSEDGRGSLRWLTVSLSGSFLASIAFFLAFFWVAERYLGDFLPALLLLSVIGFWQAIGFLKGRSWGRVLSAAFAVGLIGVSVIVSNLLALAVNTLVP